MKLILRQHFPQAYDFAAQAKQAVIKTLDDSAGYAHDGMKLYGKSLDFLSEPRFVNAYAAGMDTGHHICREVGSNDDIHNEYRVYLCCWAAEHGSRLEGDFVECGVNTGITSVAICKYLDFNSLQKRFYLYDTYRGIPLEQANEWERVERQHENENFYEECFDLAKKNFAPWPGCTLVRGMIPDTLAAHDIPKVAYLHIDMNIAAPEVAAMEHFWPRLVPSAIVLFDDYGFAGYRPQKLALDRWASSQGVAIATLPTGQGMLVKG